MVTAEQQCSEGFIYRERVQLSLSWWYYKPLIKLHFLSSCTNFEASARGWMDGCLGDQSQELACSSVSRPEWLSEWRRPPQRFARGRLSGRKTGAIQNEMAPGGYQRLCRSRSDPNPTHDHWGRWLNEDIGGLFVSLVKTTAFRALLTSLLMSIYCNDTDRQLQDAHRWRSTVLFCFNLVSDSNASKALLIIKPSTNQLTLSLSRPLLRTSVLPAFLLQ